MGKMMRPRKASLRPDFSLTSLMASVRNLQLHSHPKPFLLFNAVSSTEVLLHYTLLLLIASDYPNSVHHCILLCTFIHDATHSYIDHCVVSCTSALQLPVLYAVTQCMK